MTIQENLNKFLSKDSNKLVNHGSFTTKEFNALVKVLGNTSEDFLIFDNAGGKKFEIMFDRNYVNEDGVNTVYKVSNFIDHLLKDSKSWIFCYQINGEQVLLKEIL